MRVVVLGSDRFSVSGIKGVLNAAGRESMEVYTKEGCSEVIAFC